MDIFSLAEVRDVILGGGPVDLAAAALNGAWVNLKNSEGMDVLFISGIGTADEDPVINLQQATDATGTGAKTLQLKRVWTKVGATGFTSANDLWTPVTSIDPYENPADNFDTADINGAENALIVCAHVLDQDLDKDGFTHIRLQVADVGAGAQLGIILYVPSGRNYPGISGYSARA